MAEKQKKQHTLKEWERLRFLCRFAFILIAFVTPVLITGFKFNLFTKPTTAKWSVFGVLVLVIIAWRFKKKIGDWITSWEDQHILKHIFLGFAKVWPFLLMVAMLFLIKYSVTQILSDVLFCLEWTCACELFSYIVIYPIEMKADYQVKRTIRKNERKEDYKEAIHEMQEDGEI